MDAVPEVAAVLGIERSLTHARVREDSPGSQFAREIGGAGSGVGAQASGENLSGLRLSRAVMVNSAADARPTRKPRNPAPHGGFPRATQLGGGVRAATVPDSPGDAPYVSPLAEVPEAACIDLAAARRVDTPDKAGLLWRRGTDSPGGVAADPGLSALTNSTMPLPRTVADQRLSVPRCGSRQDRKQLRVLLREEQGLGRQIPGFTRRPSPPSDRAADRFAATRSQPRGCRLAGWHAWFSWVSTASHASAALSSTRRRFLAVSVRAGARSGELPDPIRWRGVNVLDANGTQIPFPRVTLSLARRSSRREASKHRVVVAGPIGELDVDVDTVHPAALPLFDRKHIQRRADEVPVARIEDSRQPPAYQDSVVSRRPSGQRCSPRPHPTTGRDRRAAPRAGRWHAQVHVHGPGNRVPR